jgi:RNA polymerase sigma factor (sigma-70 family)
MRQQDSSVGPLRTLFTSGAVGSLSDGELLDRFVSGGATDAESAFGALIRRHGSMVFSVCRSVLRDRHEAEDAFQATFLVLARGARSIRRREALGAWLHGVARRVSVRAKQSGVRRRAILQAAGEERPGSSELARPDDNTGNDTILHEELDRLPDRYRTPVVLCYLEGMTYERAARSLRVSEGAVRGRLARARNLLRVRLERRGMAGSMAVFLEMGTMPGLDATSLCREAAAAEAARRILIGETADGVVSASVLDLMEGVLKTMVVSKVRVSFVAVAAVSVLVVGSVVRVGLGAGGPGPLAVPQHKTEIDDSLAKLTKGKIVRSLEVSKDCMILSYIPDWKFGNVDNIGVADNDGGVRTLIDWPEISPTDALATGRRFLLALYSRKTDAGDKGGTINIHELNAAWPEITSWKTKPEYNAEPAATSRFENQNGWILFDVTPIVQARARAERKGQGVMLRFRDEDRSSGAFSGYQFVSREGKGEWEGRHPRLLLVDPPAK